VGAGHTVTAIYELRLTDSPAAALGTVRVRFADPDTGEVSEISSPIQLVQASREFDETSPAYRTTVAAAMFAEILRESPFATDVQLDELIESLEATLSANPTEDAGATELLVLMRIARSLGVTGYVPAGE
jgi:Ca-activated chloride channel family protein